VRPQNRFKLGDRVRVVDKSKINLYEKEGVVESLEPFLGPNDEPGVSVRFESLPKPVTLYEYRLTKVTTFVIKGSAEEAP
jgi:hypothetical protein